MQAKNDTFRNFLVRTDILAAHLGRNVQELPEILGIGRASLFCCRSGKRPITPKTWLKLEAAERAAGIGVFSESSTSPKQSPVASPEISDVPPDPFQRLGAALADVAAIHNFPMSALKERMSLAGAWPPTGNDLHLTPAQLYEKYSDEIPD